MKNAKRVQNSSVSVVAQGKTVELFGDKDKQIEPIHTRIYFPGGDVDVTRTTDGQYWVHIAVNHAANNSFNPLKPEGRIVDARLDVAGKHASDMNVGDFEDPNLYHLAVRIA